MNQEEFLEEYVLSDCREEAKIKLEELITEVREEVRESEMYASFDQSERDTLD